MLQHPAWVAAAFVQSLPSLPRQHCTASPSWPCPAVDDPQRRVQAHGHEQVGRCRFGAAAAAFWHSNRRWCRASAGPRSAPAGHTPPSVPPTLPAPGLTQHPEHHAAQLRPQGHRPRGRQADGLAGVLGQRLQAARVGAAAKRHRMQWVYAGAGEEPRRRLWAASASRPPLSCGPRCVGKVLLGGQPPHGQLPHVARKCTPLLPTYLQAPLACSTGWTMTAPPPSAPAPPSWAPGPPGGSWRQTAPMRWAAVQN